MLSLITFEYHSWIAGAFAMRFTAQKEYVWMQKAQMALLSRSWDELVFGDESLLDQV